MSLKFNQRESQTSHSLKLSALKNVLSKAAIRRFYKSLSKVDRSDNTISSIQLYLSAFLSSNSFFWKDRANTIPESKIRIIQMMVYGKACGISCNTSMWLFKAFLVCVCVSGEKTAQSGSLTLMCFTPQLTSLCGRKGSHEISKI